MQGASAEDNALDSPAECFRQVRFASQTTAQLTGDTRGRDDPSHTFAVDGPAGARTIEVHKMEILRALLDPAAGHGCRVVAEDGFLIVVALPESDALPAPEVNGRENEHAVSLP